MKYKISDFAKTFGLSTESIRYYERIGLIKSYRDQENNYRYYDNWDLFDLSNHLVYKNFNFSLKECITALNSSSPECLCGILAGKIQELEKKIAGEKLLLEWMTWRQQDIKSTSLNLDRIIIQEFPKMCLTETFTTEGDRFEESFLPHLVSSTYDAFFLPILKTSISRVESHDVHIERGKVIFEQYGDFLDENMPEISEIIPKQTYITYSTSVENLNNLVSIVQPLLNEIKHRGYQTKDELYGSFTARLTDGDRHIRYIRFMVPLIDP